MVSVREARILLCVGCDYPQICVGQAPASPHRRRQQRTTITPTPDRKHHPSAETSRLSLNQEESDIFERKGTLCSQGFPPYSHIRDSMCPMIRRRGSRPGAVQVLKPGFQRLQMCDERRRRRGGDRVKMCKNRDGEAFQTTRSMHVVSVKTSEPAYVPLSVPPWKRRRRQTLSLHFTS